MVVAGLRARYRNWRRTRRALRALRRWTAADEARARFYAQFVHSGSLVFDIGANVGNRAKVFLHLGAAVVAAEPQPYCQHVLRSGLGDQPAFHLECSALGAVRGVGVLHAAGQHRIASMSRQWMARVAASGRFGAARWDDNVQVTVITLDELIAKYGVPAFVKIDVEGYEAEVLRGLSQPVPAIALEFTPEHLDAARAAIAHAATLGTYAANLVLGEGLHFESAHWLTINEVLQCLPRVDPKTFGDVYLRLCADG